MLPLGGSSLPHLTSLHLSAWVFKDRFSARKPHLQWASGTTHTKAAWCLGVIFMLLFFNLHIWTVTTLLDAWSTLQQANEKKKWLRPERQMWMNSPIKLNSLSKFWVEDRPCRQNSLCPQRVLETLECSCFHPQLKGRPGGYRKGLYGEINQGLGSPGLSELSLGSCPGALPNPGLHCCIVHCALRLLSPVCTSSPSSPSSPPPPLSHCSLFPPAPPCLRICFPLSCFLPSPHPCLPLGVSVNGGRGKHKLRG